MMSFREKVNNLKSLEQCRQQDRFFTEWTNFPEAIKIPRYFTERAIFPNNFFKQPCFYWTIDQWKKNEQNRLKIKDNFMNERNQFLLNVWKKRIKLNDKRK